MEYADGVPSTILTDKTNTQIHVHREPGGILGKKALTARRAVTLRDPCERRIDHARNERRGPEKKKKKKKKSVSC